MGWRKWILWPASNDSSEGAEVNTRGRVCSRPPKWGQDPQNGVSSIRSKQGVFLFFLKAGFGREDACQIGSFDLAGLVLDLLKCRLPGGKMETGAGGGRHRLPIVLRTGFAPFAWRTGVTSSRQLAGAEYLCAMVRPGVVLPRSDRGRPVSWHTDPSRRVSTRHVQMSHPVAPSPFSLVPFAVYFVWGRCVGGKVVHWRSGRLML